MVCSCYNNAISVTEGHKQWQNLQYVRKDTNRSTPNSRQNTMTHATKPTTVVQLAWRVRILRRVSVDFKPPIRLNSVN